MNKRLVGEGMEEQGGGRRRGGVKMEGSQSCEEKEVSDEQAEGEEEKTSFAASEVTDPADDVIVFDRLGQ